MSNYYLCDTCGKKFAADVQTALCPFCQCVPYPTVHPKRVVYDHHGFGGKRLDEPLDVCKEFEGMRHG